MRHQKERYTPQCNRNKKLFGSIENLNGCGTVTIITAPNKTKKLALITGNPNSENRLTASFAV